MQIRFRIPLLAALSVLILASCSKTNKEGKHVPKDAAIVLHINGASLSSKLPWDEVKQNELFKQLYADSSVPAFVKKTLDNPENSGIDIKADLLFFVEKDSLGSYSVITGNVKDAEKFRLFNLDASEGGSESENNGIKFISKNPVCVGWNKEQFVYIMNDAYSQMQVSSSKSRDLLLACKNIFDLKESNSLAENEKFTAMVKQAGDLHLWMNSGELYKNGIPNSPLSMLNVSKLYEGNITAAAINFENGKIVFDAKSYAGKELSELYKKYGGKNIDEDMIKRLPSKDVAGILAMSFKPEGIKELLKVMGVDGLANIGLSRMGFDFTVDDFIKANKGDILLALTDLKQSANGVVEPEGLFAASIADKDAFAKLIKSGEKMTAPMRLDSMQSRLLDRFSYNSNGKYFAISNSKETTEKYITGSSNTSFDFLSKISNNPFGGYINFQFILKAVAVNFSADSSAKVIYDASLKMWDNMYIKGGKYEDGGITQNWEINLIDKNTNSLKQLNQYIGLIGKIKIESDKKNMERMHELYNDSTAFPPPPPELSK
jgi:hypothetical protein